MSRILVVDDDLEIRSSLKKLLEAEGHEVVTAADGNSAETALATGAFALMVTDIVMPDRDGLEGIRAARKLAPGMPVIAMSGGGRLGSANYLRLAQAMGASEVKPKPFEFDDMLATVERLLAEQGEGAGG